MGERVFYVNGVGFSVNGVSKNGYFDDFLRNSEKFTKIDDFLRNSEKFMILC